MCERCGKPLVDGEFYIGLLHTGYSKEPEYGLTVPDVEQRIFRLGQPRGST